ncbi:unnamed protein product [Rhizoctonia solani]|uniref:Uncharacterized protein n=1 Tax=Rhizoctonia solani TaxID=456999 RepID=A0A8H3CN91_9AGAM|nr:unnamed protein product [Rhizoctonia solani]
MFEHLLNYGHRDPPNLQPNPSQLAREWLEASKALSDLGRFEEAFEASQKAAGLCRQTLGFEAGPSVLDAQPLASKCTCSVLDEQRSILVQHLHHPVRSSWALGLMKVFSPARLLFLGLGSRRVSYMQLP